MPSPLCLSATLHFASDIPHGDVARALFGRSPEVPITVCAVFTRSLDKSIGPSALVARQDGYHPVESIDQVEQLLNEIPMRSPIFSSLDMPDCGEQARQLFSSPLWPAFTSQLYCNFDIRDGYQSHEYIGGAYRQIYSNAWSPVCPIVEISYNRLDDDSRTVTIDVRSFALVWYYDNIREMLNLTRRNFTGVQAVKLVRLIATLCGELERYLEVVNVRISDRMPAQGVSHQLESLFCELPKAEVEVY